MSSPALERFVALIQAFRALPTYYRNRTIFEVAGYPHYENVASNVLKFFLTPHEAHGMDDLVLSALAARCGIAVTHMTGEVRVHREWATTTNRRIDLIVDAPEFVIGIENKIYHHLHNDLTDYSGELAHFAAGTELAKVVLSPFPRRTGDVLPEGFQQLTYRELWREVRERIGNHHRAADPKWLLYLTDFMDTTENFDSVTGSSADRTAFYSHHGKAIQALLDDAEHFGESLVQQLATFAEYLESGFPERRALKGVSIWRSKCLVATYEFEGGTIQWDLWPTLSEGWQFHLVEHPQAAEFFREVRQREPLRSKLRDAKVEADRVILPPRPFTTSFGEIREQFIQLHHALNDAAQSLAT